MEGKKLAFILFAVLISLSFAAVPGLAGGEGLKKLKITIPVAGLNFYPVYAAQDKGFFKEQGFDFEIIVTQGDGPDVDALMAGNVEFCYTPPHRALAAYEQGKRLLIVANLMNRVGINAFVNKEVAERIGVTENTPLSEKIKKLKGLTLGCTRPGAFSYHVAVHYVKRAGYKPQEDVKVIGAGGEMAMIAAVENKKVDIGFISSPAPEIAVHRGKSIIWMSNTKGQDPEFSEFLFRRFM